PADGDDPTIAQRRADALGLVAESALAGGLDPGNSADRFQVTVHVQADTLTAREAAGEAQRVAAETREVSPAAAEPHSTAADAVPHVAAETRLASSVPSEPPAAAADAPPHVAAETRSAGSAASKPPAAAAAQGACPDGNAVSGIASAAGRPLGDPRSRNGHGKLTTDTAPFRDRSARCPREAKGHEGQEGRRAGSAARSPLRDESAGYGGGATDPSTPAPATVAAARTSAETLQANAAAREWAAPDTDRDAGLAVIEQVGGLHLGREAARRVACDAGLVVLRHGADGEVLDVGRRTRTVPSALRRALQSRDHGQCQFPGCDSRRCDAHHVEHWADGGETRLLNLTLLCRFHHRAVHEQGFQVVAGDADGQFRFLRPDGEPLPAEPPVSSWQGAPLAPTGARLAAAGINIGPHTATPDWYGESLNLTAALDVLWEPPAASAPGSS
ncbi:MAG: HNH endonuclease signature motif containing protein, partial [Spirochaetaceae bacterium]|nr:HNH endonuclease signature motif containing protein [Spirochaetaceae bacterium]